MLILAFESSAKAASVALMDETTLLAESYQNTVDKTKILNDTAVEYINGIEAIKVFNQGKKSYARPTDKVKANAQY